MQLLIFLIVYPIIWLISILPFKILYFISDITYFVVYKLIRYRKSTVRSNIALALPHLTVKERIAVESKFYHHFCDSFFEMAKTMTISRKEMERRFVFTNLELYQELEKEGKSIALMCAHYASYEWLISMNMHIDFQGFGIYKKLRNDYLDNLVRNIRSRFKATLIDTKESINIMADNKRKEILGVYGFAADQSPKIYKTFHWSKFMGHEVPVHTGAEMLAKKMDMNMIFVKICKVKRGFYEATFISLSDNPREEPNYKITDDYLKLVENQIKEAPEFYLWTHKRWKHKR